MLGVQVMTHEPNNSKLLKIGFQLKYAVAGIQIKAVIEPT